ncbi:DUF2267 domain-containing protein [Azospirillum sp. TSO22-1]|uniref:DUF2267 domain-containing protein n=1 Tax=Azospirillum sp. TSO22-1 TaxID=716789 RepID=UPI000D606751|nr:DUF2267 domain-containing protein [Azospirillum sp. TSO22-1]PWC36838.1 hypothetical protein TSO221_28685 [Azospirillum sp. TSO22-1]
MSGKQFIYTVAETEAWLHDVQRAGGFDHERQAYAALRAVLHAIRDQLTIADTARFAAQFPTLLRGLYFDGWHPNGEPGRGSLADRVREHLHGQPDVPADRALQAVQTVVAQRLGQKEVAGLW